MLLRSSYLVAGALAALVVTLALVLTRWGHISRREFPIAVVGALPIGAWSAIQLHRASLGAYDWPPCALILGIAVAVVPPVSANLLTPNNVLKTQWSAGRGFLVVLLVGAWLSGSWAIVLLSGLLT